MSEILLELIGRVVIAAMGVLLTAVVLPWLKEKRLYDDLLRLVAAAEKWAQTHEIDKHAWVCAALSEAGVEVTPRVERLIEAAVFEIDAAVKR